MTRSTIVRSASVVAFFVVWEIVGRQVNPVFLSHPSAVLVAFYEVGVQSPELLLAAGTTLFELLVGLAIALPLGLFLGLLMGSWQTAEDVLAPFVNSIYALPRIVFIPVIVLWFGLGLEAKVVFIVLMGVFPLIINTFTGIRNAPVNLVAMARSFGADRREVMRHVTLPAALPFVFAGLRLSLGMAAIGVVLSEMFTSLTGLGGLLVTYANRFQTDRVFVVVLTVAFAALLLNASVDRAERRTLVWYRSNGHPRPNGVASRPRIDS